MQGPRQARVVGAGDLHLRARDLDNFIHADRQDVRVFEYEDGFAFACYGLTPERRLLLESVYGMLTLKNGVRSGTCWRAGSLDPRRSCTTSSRPSAAASPRASTAACSAIWARRTRVS
jgi:hypothetical protein